MALIDYMALIKTNERDEIRKYETVARELACCSKKHDIGVVLLHQFGRDYEKRGGGRPKMSDFKYAGEAEADVMLGLQYLYKEKPTPENKTRMVVHYIKMRNRPINAANACREIKFDTDSQTFSDLEF